MSPRDDRLPTSNSSIVQWFKLDQFVPERAVTSHFVSSKTLLYLRIPFVLYSTIALWADIGISLATNEFHHYFAYFTRFTFVGLHAYLITTFCHHVRYIMMREPRQPRSFLDQSAILNYLYVLLYHTVITFNILTPAVYWSLLSGTLLNKSDATPIDWWMAASLHATSFFIMLFEVFLSRMVISVRIVLPVFCIVICYMLLTFIIYGSEHWWVYSFLDWNQGPSAAIWYFIVAFAVVICFFLQWGIHKLRDCCAPSNDLITDDDRTERVDLDDNYKMADLANEDKRYYSQTLVESSIESHITLGASSTEHLA